MWNRVVLLISGVALGWSLVDLWVAPPAERGRHVLRLAIASLVGLGLTVVLALENPAALLPALLVLLLSAAVAYAGHARQLGRYDEPLPRARPTAPRVWSGEVGVLLVAEGEPATYDGPEVWARQWRRRQASRRPAPHWLLRPLALARIRAAYRNLPPEGTVAGWLTGLAQDLDAALGEGYRVETAQLLVRPSPASTLARMVEEGTRQFVAVPVGPAHVLEALRQQVTASRVRELGAEVTIVDPAALPPELCEALEARLDALSRGAVPLRLSVLFPDLETTLASLVRQALDPQTVPGATTTPSIGTRE